MNNSPPDHYCPGCGVSLKYYARYAWYFCADCTNLARDHAGRNIVFFNLGLSGGLGWSYRERPQLGMTSGFVNVICLILDRQVIVGEARFGGVVCQPFGEAGSGLRAASIDLANKYDFDAMLAKMVRL